MSYDGPVQGVITKPSRYTIPETLERLENVIRSRGLTIFSRIDHSGEAERVGLRMQDAKLLIFGSPKAGTPLMIFSPLLALDLPLKALVWKDKGTSVGELQQRYLPYRPLPSTSRIDEEYCRDRYIDRHFALGLSTEVPLPRSIDELTNYGPALYYTKMNYGPALKSFHELYRYFLPDARCMVAPNSRRNSAKVYA